MKNFKILIEEKRVSLKLRRLCDSAKFLFPRDGFERERESFLDFLKEMYRENPKFFK